MYTKKTSIIFCFLFLFNGILFSNDFGIEIINGIWLQKNVLVYLFNEPDTRLRQSFAILDSQYTINWNENTKTGILKTGTEENTISKVEVNGKKITIYYVNRYFPNEIIVLEYISRDLFKVISSPYNSKPDYLCRICDFAKKPQATGIINNTGVRFRTKPELTGDIWFSLNNGEKIEILSISEEKQKIGELEAYWYEIRIKYDKSFGLYNEDRLDGWVFGAYVNVENREELEEKLIKKRTEKK